MKVDAGVSRTARPATVVTAVTHPGRHAAIASAPALKCFATERVRCPHDHRPPGRTGLPHARSDEERVTDHKGLDKPIAPARGRSQAPAAERRARRRACRCSRSWASAQVQAAS